MTRNGDMFGIRVGGLGDRWFTALLIRRRGYFLPVFAGSGQRTWATAPLLKRLSIGGAAIAARRNAFCRCRGMERRNLFLKRWLGNLSRTQHAATNPRHKRFSGGCLGLDIPPTAWSRPELRAGATGIAHKEAGIGRDWRGNRPCAAGLFRAGAGSAGGKHGRKLKEGVS